MYQVHDEVDLYEYVDDEKNGGETGYGISWHHHIWIVSCGQQDE